MDSPGILVIRADADARVGAGHVMRCLALAQAWREHDGRTILAGRLEDPLIIARLEREGIAVLPDGARAQGPSAFHTLLCASGITGNGSAWVALDGYDLGEEWQVELRGLGYRVMVLEDEVRLPRYTADILLNHGLGAESLSYTLAPWTRALLGVTYRLLRREFLERSLQRRPFPEKARRLLVTMGGSDGKNVSLLAIRALQILALPDLMVDVAVGGSNRHYPELARCIGRGGGNIRLVRQANLAELASQADLALTAGGGTCFELAYLGVPILAVITADNQEDGIRRMAAAGMIRSLGQWQDVSDVGLAKEIDLFVQDEGLRRALSQACAGLVDGRGPDRIIEEMLRYPFAAK